MTTNRRTVALGAICAAAILSGPAAVAQVSGMDAYRAAPAPPAPAWRPDLAGPSGAPLERWAMLHERARTAIAAGNFDGAKRMLDRSVRRSSDPESHYLSAVAHAGLGELAAAQRLFADAVESDEGHVGARLGLALTDIQLGHRDRAAAALAVIEAQRASCAGECRDAVALDRAHRVISHFLNQPQTL